MKTLHFLALAIVMIALPTAATAGTLLVANKSSKTLTLVNAQTGEIESVLPTEAGPHEVDVSPDGRTAVVANYGADTAGNTLTVVDIPSARVTHTIDLDEHTRPHGVVWLNDNRRAVVTTEGSQSMLVVDIADGKIEQVYPTDQDVSHMVAVRQAQDNEPAVAFVSSIGSGTVTKIVLGDHRVVSKKTGDGAEGIAVSPDGETVWIANRGIDNLVVLDTDTLKTLATLDTGEFPLRVEFTHDGEHAVVTNAREDTLSIYDVESLRLVRKVALGVEGGKGASIFGEFDASVPIGIQPAPGRLWIAHANGDRVSEVDTETWKVTRLIDAGKEPDGMGYSRMDAGTIE